MARKGLEVLSFGNRDIVYGVRLLLWLDMDDGTGQQTIPEVEGAVNEKVGRRKKSKSKRKREMDRDGERARLARQLERDARLTVS